MDKIDDICTNLQATLIFFVGRTSEGEGVQLLVTDFSSDLRLICSLVITDKPGMAFIGLISNSIIAVGFSHAVHIIVFDGSKLSVKETVETNSTISIYSMHIFKGEIMWTEQKSSTVGRIVWPGGIKL